MRVTVSRPRPGPAATRADRALRGRATERPARGRRSGRQRLGGRNSASGCTGVTAPGRPTGTASAATSGSCKPPPGPAAPQPWHRSHKVQLLSVATQGSSAPSAPDRAASAPGSPWHGMADCSNDAPGVDPGRCMTAPAQPRSGSSASSSHNTHKERRTTRMALRITQVAAPVLPYGFRNGSARAQAPPARTAALHQLAYNRRASHPTAARRTSP